MAENERPENKQNVLIESARLLVRCPEEGDQQSLEQVFCNPSMMHYLGGTWDADKVAEVIREWRGDWGAENRWSGTLLRKDTMEQVGMAGLTENTLEGEPGFELSWFVLPEHQKLGFATEITNALLRFTFENMGAERVVGATHPENPASNRVFEKLGFERLGEQHHSYDDLPGFEVQVIWVLTRERWQRGAI